jgi:RimJ/RimL family protein N-acetyltransferase
MTEPNLHLTLAEMEEIDIALSLLKEAAEWMHSKNINQWQFWMNPPAEKVDWIREGFEQKQFYWIKNEEQELLGMFRLMQEDLLYWGKQEVASGYIHSFVVKRNLKNNQIGYKVLLSIEKILLSQNIHLLRLDCNAANIGLCHYYEKNGFQKVGEKTIHSLNTLYEKRLARGE